MRAIAPSRRSYRSTFQPVLLNFSDQLRPIKLDPTTPKKAPQDLLCSATLRLIIGRIARRCKAYCHLLRVSQRSDVDVRPFAHAEPTDQFLDMAGVRLVAVA
jgi:hypothetical protein